jgi:GNAT superfamily N-acetyltransferase
MFQLHKTNSANKHFQSLVKELDKDLAIRDGDEHAFYAQFNKIDAIKYVIIAYENDEPVGCGSIKKYESNVIEVKRMFVLPHYRSKGIASTILASLENWAKELGYQKCILETGNKQNEALIFYPKNGYTKIPNYGQYQNIANSVCFEKIL